MMARQRVNPHQRGTAEHLLFNRYRQAQQRANALAAEARRLQIDADAEQAKADRYAEALAALDNSTTILRLEGPK